MNFKQKISVLSVFLLVSVTAVLFAPGIFKHKTDAQTACNFVACNNSTIVGSKDSYVFVDQAHISAVFGGKTITFFDQNSQDGDHTYQAPSGAFCGGGGDHNNGSVVITDSDWPKVQQGATSIPATVDVDWSNTGLANAPCVDSTPKLLSVTVTNASNVASKAFVWQGENIASVDGSDTLSLKKLTGHNDVFYAKDTGDKCGGGTVIVLDIEHGNAGWEFGLNKAKLGPDASTNNILKNFFSSGDCYIAGSGRVTIAGAFGTGGTGTCADGSTPDPTTGLCADGSTPVGGPTQQECDPTTASCSQITEKTCEVKALGFSLAWLVCPIAVAADSLATTLTNSFEQQLSFRVSDLSSGDSQLKKAWSIFKDLASALLIIIMLVMIISQATGGGPFDAYTVRKLLPRVVAAIILMQLSWFIVSWVVDFIDDLGRGLANIMYSPFGGGANLNDFFKLLAHAHAGTALVGTASWVALIGVIIAGFVALPIVLMFCFIAIAAVLTGLLVLIFRKIFILMALIFAPIAILLWILPGTEKYYKTWFDNFIKILFMFPIAIALIAAGRIFAYIVGTTGNGTLINFLLVMVGFFGPLFILPKTYKWGGALMNATGNAAFKASGKMQERPVGYFKKRQEALGAEKDIKRANRMGDPTRASGWRRAVDIARLDPFKTGQWDPMLGGKNSIRRRRAVDSNLAKAISGEEEGRKSAGLRLQQEAVHEEDQDGFYRRASVDTNRSQDERDAALDKVAQLGGVANNRHIASLQRRATASARQGDRSQVIAFNKFLDRNAGTMFPKMPELYKAKPSESASIPEITRAERAGLDRTINGLNAAAIGQMDEVGAEELARRLNAAERGVDNIEDPNERQAALDGIGALRGRLIDVYQDAMDSETVRPNVGTGVTRVISELQAQAHPPPPPAAPPGGGGGAGGPGVLNIPH